MKDPLHPEHRKNAWRIPILHFVQHEQVSLKDLRITAAEGDTLAQLAYAGQLLRNMRSYKDFESWQKDWRVAEGWMRAAAGRGNLFAQEYLAMTLITTLHKDSYAESLKWMRIAANRGSLIGMIMLTSCMTLTQPGPNWETKNAEYLKWRGLCEAKLKAMSHKEKAVYFAKYGIAYPEMPPEK